MNKEKILADAENKIALGNEGVCYILEDLIDSYTEELKKKIEGIPDPYPEGLFPTLSIEEINRVADFCKGAGFSIDRLSAYMYRRARKSLKEDILSELNHQ